MGNVVPIDLTKESTELNLTAPYYADYENDFEKQLFMAINLFRYDPARWIPNIEASYSNNKLLKGNKSKDSIKKALEKI